MADACCSQPRSGCLKLQNTKNFEFRFLLSVKKEVQLSAVFWSTAVQLIVVISSCWKSGQVRLGLAPTELLTGFFFPNVRFREVWLLVRVGTLTSLSFNFTGVTSNRCISYVRVLAS